MKNDYYKKWLLNNYPHFWKQIASEYQQTVTGGKVWLPGAANYFFHTEGIRWAVDPVFSSLFVNTPDNVANDIAELDLILLTHPHCDHFDISLLKQFCKRKNLIIAIPEFMSETLLSAVDKVNCDLRIVNAGDQISVGALNASAFNSLHTEKDSDVDEPELGWFIEVNGKTILIPGDIRNYDPRQLPDFGKIDWFFAHVWLGRGKALSFTENDLECFCNFINSFSPEKVCLTHLYEISRNVNDLWSFEHAGAIMNKLLTINPAINSTAVRTGQRLNLW